MEERPKYNVQRHKKATTAAGLRALVALYLAYLGWSVIRDRGQDGSLAPWMSWTAGLLFIAVAAGFGLYAYRCYQRDLKAAEVREDELPAAPDGAEEKEDGPDS